jgi:glyoxylase-like metal-dependent hydrolase (beta-lactamase superfamily II)
MRGMKRIILFLGLATVGTVSSTVTGFQIATPSAAALAVTKIEKVKDNLYVITGSSDPQAFSGGNTAVFVTDAGVVLVDTKFPGWGPTIVERVRSVTNKPITTIINTHSHNDHSGSNEHFAATVDSVVHENTRANMGKMAEYSGDKAKFLPKRTFKDKLSIGRGKDQIDLYYFGRGHTNGDTFIVFPALRTVHTGDMFAQKMLPLVDRMNGGSVLEYGQTLAKAAAGIPNVDTVIPGHRQVGTWAEFVEFTSFIQDFVSFARTSANAKKTAAQAAAEFRVPTKYKGYVVTIDPALVKAEDVLQVAYDELRK